MFGGLFGNPFLWLVVVLVTLLVYASRPRSMWAAGTRFALGLVLVPVVTVGFIVLLFLSNQPYSTSQLQQAIGVIGAPPACHLASESTGSGSGSIEAFAEYDGSGCLDVADSWFDNRFASLGLNTPEGPACGKLEVDLSADPSDASSLQVEAWSANGITKSNDCPTSLLDR
jgi:hypothetical protein